MWGVGVGWGAGLRQARLWPAGELDSGCRLPCVLLLPCSSERFFFGCQPTVALPVAPGACPRPLGDVPWDSVGNHRVSARVLRLEVWVSHRTLPPAPRQLCHLEQLVPCWSSESPLRDTQAVELPGGLRERQRGNWGSGRVGGLRGPLSEHSARRA